MKVCIVGASGKLGRYMVQHALDRGYEVVGVCRERSVDKLDAFKGRIRAVVRSAGEGGRGVRRGAHGVGSLGRSAVLDGNGAGGTRPRASRRAPRLLVRVAHHA